MSMLPLGSKTDVPLSPAPICPDWILSGAPVARCAELSRSRDGLANTVVWDCTEGRFRWVFSVDETIHILDGSVTIESDTMAPTRYGPGDVVFFPDGSQTRWHVHGYMRKLAFCRRTVPRPLGYALRAASAIRRRVWAAIRPPEGTAPGTPGLAIQPALRDNPAPPVGL